MTKVYRDGKEEKRCIWAAENLSFIIIQVPLGDFMTTYASQLHARGELMDEVRIAALRARKKGNREFPFGDCTSVG